MIDNEILQYLNMIDNDYCILTSLIECASICLVYFMCNKNSENDIITVKTHAEEQKFCRDFLFSIEVKNLHCRKENSIRTGVGRGWQI